MRPCVQQTEHLSTHVRNYGDVFRQAAGASRLAAMQAYQITSPIRLLNTSPYFRIVVLSAAFGSVAPKTPF
jgi:hypothetical protein